MQIGTVPRIPLATLPTPLQEMSRLRKRLGGPRLFIKRDDLTGLGLGGNKLRKLEYAMAAARHEQATVIVTIGAPQSNHVRLTTAAANHLGLKTVLVLRGEEPRRATGNLLIDRILGAAEIHFVGGEGYPTKSDVDRIADEKAVELAERLRADGERPYIIPNGCRAIHGAYGYAGCVLETVNQLHAQGLAADAFIAPVGTSSTLTGLILGAHLYSHGGIDVVGISVANPADTLITRIAGQLDEAARTLALDRSIPEDAIEVWDDYIGPGYGLPTAAMADAVETTAREEGILLDPVYTGKAMAGLFDRIRRHRFRDDDVVVFVHTGGIPALFADTQIDAFAPPQDAET